MATIETYIIQTAVAAVKKFTEFRVTIKHHSYKLDVIYMTSSNKHCIHCHRRFTDPRHFRVRDVIYSVCTEG